MYRVEVIYLDLQKDSIEFDRKPSIDVRGSTVYLECGSGQKLAINSFLCVKIFYPTVQTQPIKYVTNCRYNTKNENTEVLLHSVEPKVELKNNNVIYLKESDNIVRVVNGEWLESIKIDLFSDLAKGK